MLSFYLKSGDLKTANFLQLNKWKAQFPYHKTKCAVEKDFYPKYMYCMKSKLPKTSTISFNPKDMKNYRPKYEKAPKGMVSFMQYCKGDSGSGQFISNNVNKYMNLPKDTGNLRYLLAGIFIKGFVDKFEDENGQTHLVPCGTYAYDEKTMKYLESTEVSMITTNQKILNWIKGKSNIEGKLDYLFLMSR